MQAKHKTLGCTLVVTQNYLVTLREDFTAPLRQWQMIKKSETITKPNIDGGGPGHKASSLLNSSKGRLEPEHMTTNCSSLVRNVNIVKSAKNINTIKILQFIAIFLLMIDEFWFKYTNS